MGFSPNLGGTKEPLEGTKCNDSFLPLLPTHIEAFLLFFFLPLYSFVRLAMPIGIARLICYVAVLLRDPWLCLEPSALALA